MANCSNGRRRRLLCGVRHRRNEWHFWCMVLAKWDGHNGSTMVYTQVLNLNKLRVMLSVLTLELFRRLSITSFKSEYGPRKK